MCVCMRKRVCVRALSITRIDRKTVIWIKNLNELSTSRNGKTIDEIQAPYQLYPRDAKRLRKQPQIKRNSKIMKVACVNTTINVLNSKNMKI